MKQILKLVFLLVIGQTAFGQAPSNYTNINGRYRWIAGMFDSTFHIPKGTTPSLRTGGSTNSGGLFYNTSDSSVYTYTGTQWIKLRGSINPSDTTNKYVTQVYKKSGSDSIFYVKGGTHTWAFNDSTGSPGGGGGGKVYYFNGGVSMGTIGGIQMYELGDTANTGAAANFTRSTTGNIANFITDPGKPGLVQIPAGVWSVDAWLSETGGGANHAEIWIEVEKWDGATITTIATSPIEQITEGATPNLYSWSVTIPTTSLTITDRIVIQFYISNTNGKTVTLYTQNGYVGEVHTTFTTGIGAINGLTAPAQYLVTGTSGTDFNINSATATHTFNLPTASATNRGALSTTDWSTFNSKIGPSDTASMLSPYLRKADTTAMLNPYFRLAGVGLKNTGQTVYADTLLLSTRAWRQKGIDSVASLITGGYVPNSRTITINGTSQDLSANRTYNVGTVTSVATNTGTGITGGTFTTSGTIAADTLLLSTRAWRQKGVDSVASLINTRISGTTNYIPKFTSSSAIGNSVIYESVGSIGIGTTSPITFAGYTSVATDGTSGSAFVTMANGTSALRLISSTSDAALWEPRNSPVLFGTNNTERLRITSTGLVGIGTSTPGSYSNNAYNLVVGGTLDAGITIFGNSAEGSSNLYLADGTTGDQAYRGFLRYTHSNDALTIGTSGTTRMTLDASGNLGIGTTSPSEKLDLQGTMNINGASGTYLQVQYNGANRGYLGTANATIASGATTDLGISATSNLVFGTGGSLTERMRISSGGNVGIGTSSPNSISGYTILDIQNTTNGGLMQFGTNGTGYGQLYNNTGEFQLRTIASIPLTFGTNNTERMRITSGGDIGIGTTSPASYDASGNNLVVYENGNAGITIATPSTGYGNLFFADGTGSAAAYAGYLEYNHNNNALAFGTNSSERMRLDASGNLGLGVTPSAWLSGYPVIQMPQLSIFSGAGGGGFIFGNAFLNTSGSFTYQNSGLAASAYNNQGGAHQWSIAPSGTAGNAISFTQAMTLDASGRLGIGTTSPFSKLEVNSGTSTAPTLKVYSTPSSYTANMNVGIIDLGTNASGNDVPAFRITGISETAASSANGYATFSTRSGSTITERMRITSGGEVYIAGTTDQGAYNLQVNGTGVWGAGAYVNGSDSALKQNIQPLDNSLDLVKQMKPVTYTYKESYSKDTSVQTGFIAQDLQILLKDKNYLNGIVKDGTYLSVAYQNLIPLLVKAIQEQQIEIENLKKQIK